MTFLDLRLGRLRLTYGTPERPTLYLVRHGQSLSNVDRNVHNQLPDALIPLSDLGRMQALQAGDALGRRLKAQGWPRRIRVFHSEYLRAQQTAELVIAGLRGHTPGMGEVMDHKSDSRIHELEFGWLSGLPEEERDALMAKTGNAGAQSELLRKHGAKFFDRRMGGESPADVEVRLRSFFTAIYRDRDENGIGTFIVVSHGLTNRVFAKAWLGKDFYWYEKQANPRNCAIRLMTPERTDGGYIHFGGKFGPNGEMVEETTPTEGH